MPAYDDTDLIARVRQLMTDKAMSRRAAIIEVAGADSLRRIEVKMSKEDASTQKAPANDQAFHANFVDRNASLVEGTFKTMAGWTSIWITRSDTGDDMLLNLPEQFPSVSKFMLPGHRIEIYHAHGKILGIKNTSSNLTYVVPVMEFSEAIMILLSMLGFILSAIVGLALWSQQVTIFGVILSVTGSIAIGTYIEWRSKAKKPVNPALTPEV